MRLRLWTPIRSGALSLQLQLPQLPDGCINVAAAVGQHCCDDLHANRHVIDRPTNPKLEGHTASLCHLCSFAETDYPPSECFTHRKEAIALPQVHSKLYCYWHLVACSHVNYRAGPQGTQVDRVIRVLQAPTCSFMAG